MTTTVHQLHWRMKGETRWRKAHTRTSHAESAPQIVAEVMAKGLWVHMPASEIEATTFPEQLDEGADLFAGKTP